MGNLIKLDKEAVTEALQKIQGMINVSESDLSAFEKVAKELLTDQNTSSSRKMRKLAETNDEKARGRKKVIEEAVENLRTAHAALTRYAEGFEM